MIRSALFRQFLRTITNRSIRRYLSDQQDTSSVNYPLEDVAGEADSPDAAWEQAEREERWQACYSGCGSSSAVSPRDFEAFESYVLKRKPAEAVAKRLGIKVDRIYTIKHELIRRLRRIREELDIELGEV